MFTNCIGDAFLNLATVLRCPCRHARFTNLVLLIFGAIYSSVHNIVARTKPLPPGSSKLKEKTMTLCELKHTYKPSTREAETEESQVLDQRWSYREALSHTAKGYRGCNLDGRILMTVGSIPSASEERKRKEER